MITFPLDTHRFSAPAVAARAGVRADRGTTVMRASAAKNRMSLAGRRAP
jgi:hypothetical protein